MTKNAAVAERQQEISPPKGDILGAPVTAGPAIKMSTSLAALGFTAKKQVTFDLLRHEEIKNGDVVIGFSAVAIKVVSPMFVGKETKTGRGGAPKQQPAMLVQVIDLTDGVEKQYIVGKALEGVFNDAYSTLVPATVEGGAPSYTDPKYVGLCFGIEKSPEKKKGANGDYHTYRVVELETPANIA